MTASGLADPPSGGGVEPAIVDGVDMDALAAAIRACPGVDELDGGRRTGMATYLPGRRVPGIRIEPGRISVAVRGSWNTPVAAIASQIRAATAPLLAGQVVDIELTDLADPPGAADEAASPTAAALVAPAPAPSAPQLPQTPAAPPGREDDQQAWPTPHTTPPDAPPAGSSSGPTTQMSAGTPPSS